MELINFDICCYVQATIILCDVLGLHLPVYTCLYLPVTARITRAAPNKLAHPSKSSEN